MRTFLQEREPRGFIDGAGTSPPRRDVMRASERQASANRACKAPLRYHQRPAIFSSRASRVVSSIVLSASANSTLSALRPARPPEPYSGAPHGASTKGPTAVSLDARHLLQERRPRDLADDPVRQRQLHTKCAPQESTRSPSGTYCPHPPGVSSRSRHLLQERKPGGFNNRPVPERQLHRTHRRVAPNAPDAADGPP